MASDMANIQEVLKQVQEGTLSAEQAEAMLREEHFAGKTAAKKTLMENHFAEMGYAKLDTDRKRRTCFAEVVFCSGKSVEQLVSIYRRIYDTEGSARNARPKNNMRKCAAFFRPFLMTPRRGF